MSTFLFNSRTSIWCILLAGPLIAVSVSVSSYVHPPVDLEALHSWYPPLASQTFWLKRNFWLHASSFIPSTQCPVCSPHPDTPRTPGLQFSLLSVVPVHPSFGSQCLAQGGSWKYSGMLGRTRKWSSCRILLYTSDEKTRGKTLIDLKHFFFFLIELSSVGLSKAYSKVRSVKTRRLCTISHVLQVFTSCGIYLVSQILRLYWGTLTSSWREIYSLPKVEETLTWTSSRPCPTVPASHTGELAALSSGDHISLLTSIQIFICMTSHPDMQQSQPSLVTAAFILFFSDLGQFVSTVFCLHLHLLFLFTLWQNCALPRTATEHLFLGPFLPGAHADGCSRLAIRC